MGQVARVDLMVSAITVVPMAIGHRLAVWGGKCRLGLVVRQALPEGLRVAVSAGRVNSRPS